MSSTMEEREEVAEMTLVALYGSAYERAENRVKRSPQLSRHSDTILYDWPEGDSHWKWVATAPVKEIVSWAEHVESSQDEDKDE